MQYVRRVWDRLVAWRRSRTVAPVKPVSVDFLAGLPSLSRDVSSGGVRFFSLCGTCGERMEISATLCDDCARKRTGFSGNF
jgi:hypothetical protein